MTRRSAQRFADRRTRRLVFVLAGALTLFFALRLVGVGMWWADPAHREGPLEGWMTPRFVAHSRHVPREVVADALELDLDGTGRRITLNELAKARGVPVEVLVTALETAIAEHSAAR